MSPYAALRRNWREVEINGGVDSVDLAVNSVGTGALINRGILGADIAEGAVTGTEVADGSLGLNKLKLKEVVVPLDAAFYSKEVNPGQCATQNIPWPSTPALPISAWLKNAQPTTTVYSPWFATPANLNSRDPGGTIGWGIDVCQIDGSYSNTFSNGDQAMPAGAELHVWYVEL